MIIDAHAHIMTSLRGTTARGPTRSLSWGVARWGDETIQLLPPFNERTTFPAEALLAQMNHGLLVTELIGSKVPFMAMRTLMSPPPSRVSPIASSAPLRPIRWRLMSKSNSSNASKSMVCASLNSN